MRRLTPPTPHATKYTTTQPHRLPARKHTSKKGSPRQRSDGLHPCRRRRAGDEVARFLASQAAAKAAHSSFTAISSPRHAHNVSATPVLSAQAEPEGGHGGGMASCTRSPSYPVEEATSGGGAQPRKRPRVRCCFIFSLKGLVPLSVCMCVCLSRRLLSLLSFLSPRFSPLSSFHLINPSLFQLVYGY